VKKGLETAPPQHDRVHRPLRRNSNQVFFEVPYNRFVRWARRGVWENLFRELAGNGREIIWPLSASPLLLYGGFNELPFAAAHPEG
jgi:hypothetical protein